MGASEAARFRREAYVGLRSCVDRVPLGRIALELALSEGTTATLSSAWASEADGEVARRLLRAYRVDKVLKTAERRRGAERAHGPKPSLGWRFDDDDQAAFDKAVAEAESFMAGFGRGRAPREGGMFYAPDSRPRTEPDRWLTLEAAALFCGCTEEAVASAGRSGEVDCRPYLRTSHRVFYEYLMGDLEVLKKNLARRDSADSKTPC